MNERNLEELSAMVDGEASELEVRRVLKNMEQDPALAERWARYQTVSAVLRGETRGQATQWRQVDLSARIAQAIDSEPALAGVETPAGRKGLSSVFLKPFANVAVAASVSAAVILGWQTVNQQPVTASGPVAGTAGVSGGVVVSGSVPGGMSSGLMPVAQTSGGYRPATVVNAPEIIRYNPELDDRLNDYLISHSSNAAFSTAAGVAPYARVVALKPAAQSARNPSPNTPPANP